MKKLLFLLAFVPAIGLPFVGWAQFKIGEITIDSATARQYFVDCYIHPDTLKFKTWWEFSEIERPKNRPYMIDAPPAADAAAEAYNAQLKREAIEVLTKGYTNYYIRPRKPTELDFIRWYAKTHIGNVATEPHSMIGDCGCCCD
jgi:hypothetical protein